MKLTAQSRAALMSRLAGNMVPPSLAVTGTGANTVPIGVHAPAPMPAVPAGLAMEQGVLGPASPIPTQCLLLKNMFNPAE